MGDPLRRLRRLRLVRLVRVAARHPSRSALLYRRVLGEVDEESLAAARSRIAASVSGLRRGHAVALSPEQQKSYTKYLDVGYYLRRNVARALKLGLDRPPTRRILDLGCGAGFFLAVCRNLGHEVQGLDLGAMPVFDELTRLLALPRVEHEIRPGVPLPRFAGEPFDLITAFAVRFDRLRDGRRWSPADWGSFLADVRSRLASGGVLVCRWNRSSRDRMRSDPLRGLFTGCRGLEARFPGDRRVVFRRTD